MLRIVFTMFHRGVDFFPVVGPVGRSYSSSAFRERNDPPGKWKRMLALKPRCASGAAVLGRTAKLGNR